MIRLFEITYTDLKTDELKTIRKEFEDTPEAQVVSTLFEPYSVSISAREWAEDYAYSLADKGPFTVKEVQNG